MEQTKIIISAFDEQGNVCSFSERKFTSKTLFNKKLNKIVKELTDSI